MQLVRVPFAGRDPGEPLALRDLAFNQLANKIGAPPGYIKNLPAKLQVANMNWGLAQKKSPALLRLADGEVRAVLSDRYAAADDELLLDMVADCLDRTGFRNDALVRATAIGPHTIMRITLPNEGTPVKVGDVIEHGIDIGNSELGLRSVQVTPITFRLQCTNGMRAWKSEAALRMRHIGDPARLRDQLREAIPVAFAEARGDVEKWSRAVDTLIDSALDDIEMLRGFGLSTGEVQSVARTLAAGLNLLPESTGSAKLSEVLDVEVSVFEVANAITATAREKESVASRLQMEEVGHRYLTRRVA
ncbi:DUF932 domain-containing protein [bacterium AH-315-N03]|nr:DUF932 domain-containing protein [bacterium AH-315-N03]